jgi:hypothetical protein
MKCPICETEAEEINPPSFDAKSIRCQSCGDFDISGNTWDLALLEPLTTGQRETALQKARKGVVPPKRPLITSYVIDP